MLHDYQQNSRHEVDALAVDARRADAERTEHAAECGEVRRLVEAVGGDQMQIVHARALDVHVNLFRVFL